jgi:hypothetical protein
MPKLFPDDSQLCIPLIIGDGISETGSRIGGSPPSGIRPPTISASTRYFATIQISDAPVIELSIFLNFDFDEMLDGAGILHSSNRLVQLITHSESTRGDDSDILSDLSPHPIVHGKRSDDWIVDDVGERHVRAHHKLGGRPFLQNIGEDLSASVSRALEEHYFQVVQIDFPNAKDASIDGVPSR